jgi:cytochrome c biogenesis protein CcmG/thiol:disulfide interchange protein DsbE
MKLTRLFPAYLVLTLSTISLLAPRALGQDHPSQSAPDKLLPEASRKPAPGFSLTDANGKQIQLSDYRGKVVLLDFWATWCGGCKLEIPWYMEFDQKYRQQGLAVIGVSMDDDGWKAVKPFLARKTDPETGGNTSMKYPVVIGNDQLGKAYNLTSMPMTLLIDRRGNIALSHTGVVNKNDFEAHILQLLN